LPFLDDLLALRAILVSAVATTSEAKTHFGFRSTLRARVHLSLRVKRRSGHNAVEKIAQRAEFGRWDFKLVEAVRVNLNLPFMEREFAPAVAAVAVSARTSLRFNW
jgi:hypothetical protein